MCIGSNAGLNVCSKYPAGYTLWMRGDSYIIWALADGCPWSSVNHCYLNAMEQEPQSGDLACRQ
jgi:hypothetical protein